MFHILGEAWGLSNIKRAQIADADADARGIEMEMGIGIGIGIGIGRGVYDAYAES